MHSLVEQLLAIRVVEIKSELVLECLNELLNIRPNKVTVMWVLEHAGVEGN